MQAAPQFEHAIYIITPHYPTAKFLTAIVEQVLSHAPHLFPQLLVQYPKHALVQDITHPEPGATLPPEEVFTQALIHAPEHPALHPVQAPVQVH